MAKVETVAKERRGVASSGSTRGEREENGTKEVIGGSKGVGGTRCRDWSVECW